MSRTEREINPSDIIIEHDENLRDCEPMSNSTEDRKHLERKPYKD